MLTLTPGSACDVCAEEYGSHRLPHSIPCGHVLCASCCTTIVEKTSPRLSPVCPFCRVQFTSDNVRLIRMDFTTSGWSTPRRFPTVEANSSDFTSELLAKRTERLLLSEGSSKTRLEARRLEDKVARVAAKKCSVEEVSTLHKELEEWLMSEVKDDQTSSSSLYLSAALLRAILVNHVAHSEASKNHKSTEASLKGRLDDIEIINEKLESELRRQRTQYAQKSEECQQLRTEVSRLRALASTLGYPSSDSRPLSPTSPTSTPPSTSPVPPYTPSSQSPLRYNSLHARSASMSSRPSTPATPISPSRSHTPAISSTRSHTPAPLARSHTPSLRSQTPSLRSHTPAPPLPRYATPAPPSGLRSQTPAPPPMIPPKPRRLSTPSPPKMMRSTSEEKQEAHERWIPPNADPSKIMYPGRSPSVRPPSVRPPSRSGYLSSAYYNGSSS